MLAYASWEHASYPHSIIGTLSSCQVKTRSTVNTTYSLYNCFHRSAFSHLACQTNLCCFLLIFYIVFFFVLTLKVIVLYLAKLLAVFMLNKRQYRVGHEQNKGFLFSDIKKLSELGKVCRKEVKTLKDISKK